MSKSGKSKTAQKARRKVQSANTRGRKNTSRPSYKKTAAEKKVTEKKAAEKKVTEKKIERINVRFSESNKATEATETRQETKIKQSAEKKQILKSDKISHFAKTQERIAPAETKQIEQAAEEPLASKKVIDDIEVKQSEIDDQPIISNFDIKKVNKKLAERKETYISQPQPGGRHTAKDIKEAAIRKAMQSVSRQERDFQERNRKRHFNFGIKRVVLALSCAAAAVFAIVYFMNISAPDVSLKVAAMQSGINASYPSYVPRDYALAGITSENGKISLNFRNSDTGGAYTLVEESSSWDSTTLQNNYVKSNYDADYAVVKEQGLTLYMTDDATCWVNGGIVYKLNVTSGALTKKQIKAIAVSL